MPLKLPRTRSVYFYGFGRGRLTKMLELAKKGMRVVGLVRCQNMLACKAESKDPFASRNAVLLSLVGIRKVSDGGVRQAVFAVKPIVGA